MYEALVQDGRRFYGDDHRRDWLVVNRQKSRLSMTRGFNVFDTLVVEDASRWGLRESQRTLRIAITTVAI